MIENNIVIPNKLGLHARAATKFANVCNRFACDFKIQCKGKTVDGKSIMSLMLLAASKGTEITIATTGSDEAEGMQALLDLINDKFGEGE